MTQIPLSEILKQNYIKIEATTAYEALKQIAEQCGIEATEAALVEIIGGVKGWIVLPDTTNPSHYLEKVTWCKNGQTIPVIKEDVSEFLAKQVQEGAVSISAHIRIARPAIEPNRFEVDGENLAESVVTVSSWSSPPDAENEVTE